MELSDMVWLALAVSAFAIVVPTIYVKWVKDKEQNGYDPDNEW